MEADLLAPWSIERNLSDDFHRIQLAEMLMEYAKSKKACPPFGCE